MRRHSGQRYVLPKNVHLGINDLRVRTVVVGFTRSRAAAHCSAGSEASQCSLRIPPTSLPGKRMGLLNLQLTVRSSGEQVVAAERRLVTNLAREARQDSRPPCPRKALRNILEGMLE
jgi:hypothetical protein